jgi:hypothetical protein
MDERRGRPGIALTRKEKEAISKYMSDKCLTYQEFADMIGLTRRKVEYPLCNGRCSKETYPVFQKFLGKIYKRSIKRPKR